MVHVATVMAPREAFRLTDDHVRAVASALGGLRAKILDHNWLGKGEACDVFFEGDTPADSDILAAAGLDGKPVDCIVQGLETRPKALLVADMDSTIIEQECIDEIAGVLGLKEKIAPITEAAMQGKLDFKGALRERVALLEGIAKEDLQGVLDTRISFMPGAKTLIATLKAKGIKTGLVSGGFTFFTEPLGTALGFDFRVSNSLLFDGDFLTGKVKEPIVDGEVKKAFLLEQAGLLGGPNRAIAIGDGANDIPMFKAAGFSISYHGKRAAEEAAKGRLRHMPLTGVLYALGIAGSDFAK